MPSPDQLEHVKRPLSNRFPGFAQQAESDLAAEVAALRKEIAALRAELKPVPSLILTGQQVADTFKRLSEVRP